jgi:hypothetical protein
MPFIILPITKVLGSISVGVSALAIGHVIFEFISKG